MRVGGHVNDDGRLGVLRFDGRDDLLLVGEGEFLEGVAIEVAGPRVEDLNDLRARVDLVARVRGDILREEAEDVVQQRGVAFAERLDFAEARLGPRLALDEIRRQREREPDEAEHRRRRPLRRGLAAQRGAQAAQDLADEGARGGRVEVVVERVEGLARAHGRDLDGAALRDGEFDAHRGQRRQNVREQNDAVDAVRVPRLQRDLERGLGDLGPLAEGRVLGHEVAVHLHVPPRLPHHPHRRVPDGLAAGRAQQRRLPRELGCCGGGLARIWCITRRRRRRRRHGGRGHDDGCTAAATAWSSSALEQRRRRRCRGLQAARGVARDEHGDDRGAVERGHRHGAARQRRAGDGCARS
mmetsp:Transcript_18456/g.73725  ORF Transcript_18456/g.73725 Transcript_18456/m.73725 type:complete len:355 (-) Transcript_18456:22-1086(-)